MPDCRPVASGPRFCRAAGSKKEQRAAAGEVIRAKCRVTYALLAKVGGRLRGGAGVGLVLLGKGGRRVEAGVPCRQAVGKGVLV